MRIPSGLLLSGLVGVGCLVVGAPRSLCVVSQYFVRAWELECEKEKYGV